MNSIARRFGRSAGGLGFCVLQIALLTGAWAATSRRLEQMRAGQELPPLRETPVEVTPLYDRPDIVTDEQLRAVLERLKPHLRQARPNINHVDHALRLWGAEAEFPQDPGCPSGREMLGLLLDHKQYAAAWGDESQPLLIESEQGVRFRAREGEATISHTDHALAGLAELGVPIHHRVTTPNSEATVAELLAGSLRSFRLNQAEYEWSTLACALYLPHAGKWRSADGQRITFDRLARRILREPHGNGVCYGNHRLHALVVLLRVDEQHEFLSPSVREEVLAHLQDATARLTAHQHPYGFWDGKWPEHAPRGAASDSSALGSRLLATGHAMEWWALAPAEIHPPREVLVRAGQWLCRSILELDDAAIRKNYTFLTHAGRALALWRSREPADVIKAY